MDEIYKMEKLTFFLWFKTEAFELEEFDTKTLMESTVVYQDYHPMHECLLFIYFYLCVYFLCV